jgi:hypothetical protein
MTDTTVTTTDTTATAANAGAFTLDLPFDSNLVPEAHRPMFTEAKLGKWSDVVNFAVDNATKAKATGQFNKDMKLDPAAFPSEYQNIFSAKKIETVGALADMAFNGEKLIGGLGDKTMAPPKAGKIGEWLAANADTLGKPAKAEEYAWNKPKLPDGMDFDVEKEAAFRKFAHDNHLPNDMFQTFADFGANLLIQEAAGQQAKVVKETTLAREELVKEWGNDFKKNQETALFAARNLNLSNDMIDKLSGENGGPHTLRLLASLGAKMDGAKVINGDGASVGIGKAAAQASLEALERDPVKSVALMDGGHVQHDAVVAEREGYLKQIHAA